MIRLTALRQVSLAGIIKVRKRPDFMEHVLAQLDARAEDDLQDLMKLLRIPSVSADPAHRNDMLQAAQLIHDLLSQCGCDAELMMTPGHPIVYAEWTGRPGAPTVLVYGHYDVQPPDPLDEWVSPPFEPEVRDGRLYARGATDDKGQLFTHIMSVQAWLRATGGLPVNVKFVIEGEEEVGSKNLDNFLQENRERLQADVAVISDTAQYGPGLPAITYGLRGIAACEVRVQGPQQDLHSGVFGGAVANPANVLARLIASLHDESGRVQIPGFYDEVAPLSDEERRDFAQLPFDEPAFAQGLGVPELSGEQGFTALERRWARPTCDVNGLTSGYQGEGPKTIIPAWAVAKITCRLVPFQDPDRVLESLEACLRSRCPRGVTLSFRSWHGCAGVLCERNSPYMSAARRAVEKGFGAAPALIREGGSIPVVATFKQILGVDTLLLGWGQNTDNLHSPNEHFSVDALRQGARASAWLWQELARSVPAHS